MIMPMIASIFLIIAIVCFLNLTPKQSTDDLMSMTAPKFSLREKARALRAGKKKKSLSSRLLYVQSALEAMGKSGKFALVCSASLALLAVGAVVAILIDNVFLIPVLSVALAMIPFIYVRNTLSYYKKHMQDELETTLSIITTSYNRSEDIVSAVEENLAYINPPLNECFSASIGDAVSVSTNTKLALRNLKRKVDNEIFQ